MIKQDLKENMTYAIANFYESHLSCINGEKIHRADSGKGTMRLEVVSKVHQMTLYGTKFG